MSRNELHDLLAKLEQETNQLDPVNQEQHRRLQELVESLEQQKLYPEDFDQYTVLATQVSDMVAEYESNHPSVAAVLNAIGQALQNFKV